MLPFRACLFFLAGVLISVFQSWFVVLVCKHIQQRVVEQQTTTSIRLRATNTHQTPQTWLPLLQFEVLPTIKSSLSAGSWEGVNSTLLLDLRSDFLPPPLYECRRMTMNPTFTQCFYTPAEDKFVSATISKEGKWDVEQAMDLRRAWLRIQSQLQRPIFFVDIGANLGLFSLYAAAVGLENILAFEPLPATAGIFSASIGLNNGFRFVHLTNRGGSSFSQQKINAEGVPANEQVIVRDVPVVPLDAVISRRVDVMKIDVEGFESCVIQGAQKLLRTYGVSVIFIEIWRNVTPCHVDTPAFLYNFVELGYELYQSFSAYLLDGSAARLTPESALAAGLAAGNERFIEIVCIRPDLLKL